MRHYKKQWSLSEFLNHYVHASSQFLQSLTEHSPYICYCSGFLLLSFFLKNTVFKFVLNIRLFLKKKKNNKIKKRPPLRNQALGAETKSNNYGT